MMNVFPGPENQEKIENYIQKINCLQTNRKNMWKMLFTIILFFPSDYCFEYNGLTSNLNKMFQVDILEEDV